MSADGRGELMELGWRLFGWKRVKLTSADCSGRLREISGEMRIERIEFEGELTVCFDAARPDVKRIVLRDGERLEIVDSGGLPQLLDRVWKWRGVALIVLILGALTVFLPTRLLLFRVEGNGEVPARRILEEAEGCGLYFGASRRELRSEQVKNHLLYAIPELRWAGVNTNGCIATITVSVRDDGDAPEEEMPGDIVAVADGVVTEVFPQSGTALVSPGQAVKEGQMLISGMTDLGLSTRADRAEGEVYALTRRSVTVRLPEKTVVKRETGAVVKKFSLLIGKKRVNFSNDSGILHGTCVKMRTVNYMTLPGGFSLPVAVVTETYTLCETEEIERAGEEQTLLDAAERWVRGKMIAGKVETEDRYFRGNTLEVTFGCRELIGGFRPGIYMERDTNDRENGERRTG